MSGERWGSNAGMRALIARAHVPVGRSTAPNTRGGNWAFIVTDLAGGAMEQVVYGDVVGDGSDWPAALAQLRDGENIEAHWR